MPDDFIRIATNDREYLVRAADIVCIETPLPGRQFKPRGWIDGVVAVIYVRSMSDVILLDAAQWGILKELLRV